MIVTIDAFRQAMSNAGVEPPGEIIADSILHRFTVPGDKARSENGWYVLHADDPAAGAFGSWKSGVQETWSGKAYQTMTPAEKTAHAANMEAVNLARKAEKGKKHAECRAWCAKKWDRSEDATDENPYLKSRGVNAYGVKSYKDTLNKDILIVPVRDVEGTLHGLQFIAPDSAKRFKIGTDKIGHFHSIGKAEGKTLLIAEGYATAASIHRATGHPVVVAFDKGNLKPVAQIIRAKCPHLKIIICADNDQWTEGNPGLAAATEAARAVNGLLVVPVFEGVRHE